MAQASETLTHRLIAAPHDDLCLDFANTLMWRGSDPMTETLTDPGALSGWLSAHGLSTPGRVAPTLDAESFSAAIALREVIYRLFDVRAAGAPVADDDLAALNAALAEAPSRQHIARGDERIAWTVAAASSVPGLLAPVLWSAGDLLAAADHHRLRRCDNDKCRWLFLDRSKTGQRRWCDMSSCGNRAKAQRHYRRSKGEALANAGDHASLPSTEQEPHR